MADNEGISQNQTVDSGMDQRLQTKLIADTIDELEECKSFGQWIRSNELQYILRRSGLHTLFVPTDQAFRPPTSGDPEDYLSRHLLSGAAETFDLSRCKQVKSATGETVPVSEGGMRIGNARILHANIACTNGVVHVVDSEP